MVGPAGRRTRYLRAVPRQRDEGAGGDADAGTDPAAPSALARRTAAQRGAAPLVRVGRQAIFDAQRHLRGYELLFRADDSGQAGLHTTSERDVATSQVLSAALGDFGAAAISQGLPLFINLTRAFVVGELPLVVGPQAVVLEVTEDIAVDDDVLAGLARLRAEGYRIALDDFEGEEWRLPALAHADYVKVVLAPEGAGGPGGTDGPGGVDRFGALAALVAQVRALAPTALLVVERVEDEEDLAACRALGIDLFQGYGLERPVTLVTPSMDALQATALRLVAALADAEVTATEIERLVAGDPGLSMKVLRAASSSAAAPSAPISSVRQAIVMLGPRALASWTTLIVLSTGFATAQRQSALTFVLARAGACARLATEAPHVAHTVGLVSGMADALGVPVADLVGQVHLHEDVTAALTRFEGPAGEALAAVLLTEDRPGPAPALDPAAVPQASVHRERAALAYLDALGEAMALSSALGA